jgi:hypothetical protein
VTKYRCVNCPSRPVFLDFDSLKEHFRNTHTVPLEHTVAELTTIHPLVAALLGDKINTPIKLYEVIPEPVTA